MNSMIQSALKATLAVLAFSAAQTMAAVSIPSEVPFHKNTTVSKAVREECELGSKVSAFIDKYSDDVIVSDAIGEGRHIKMSITEAHVPGGGAWSGPKWLEVTGTLMEGEKKIASFRAKRFSTGGAFGGFKGNCSIVGRCAKAIGKDIAKWLKDPVDGAELGDAR